MKTSDKSKSVTRASFEASFKREILAMFSGSKIKAADVAPICIKMFSENAHLLVLSDGKYPTAIPSELKKDAFCKVLRVVEINQ